MAVFFFSFGIKIRLIGLLVVSSNIPCLITGQFSAIKYIRTNCTIFTEIKPKPQPGAGAEHGEPRSSCKQPPAFPKRCKRIHRKGKLPSCLGCVLKSALELCLSSAALPTSLSSISTGNLPTCMWMGTAPKPPCFSLPKDFIPRNMPVAGAHGKLLCGALLLFIIYSPFPKPTSL